MAAMKTKTPIAVPATRQDLEEMKDAIVAEMATKADLVALKADLVARIDMLDARIEHAKADILKAIRKAQRII